MKALFTAVEIKKFAERQESTLYVEKNSIITPAARDAAREYGIEIVVGVRPEGAQSANNACGAKTVQCSSQGEGAMEIDPDVLARIVGQVMACLQQTQQTAALDQDIDPCGLRLIRADKAVLESLTTGGAQGRVKVRELFGRREGNQLSAGIMTMEDTSLVYESKGDETRYILDGTLECMVNGKKYAGKAGDVFFIPAKAKVTFATPNQVKIFFVTCPTA